MSNQIISLIGWRFLPDLSARCLQSLYYSLTIRAGNPRPATNSPKYNRDRRLIYILVVSAYLLFLIFEAYWEIQKNPHFFQILKLSANATDREIKTRFRRLAALYHPDKVATLTPSTEAYFVKLKLAQDTLLDPVKRFAYERFGPAMLEWERCSTMRDYIVQGLYSIIPNYCAAAFVMCFMAYLGYVNIGNFWRWLIFSCFCLFELRTISSPNKSPLLTQFINPILTKFTNHSSLLPFQFTQLAHKISVTLYIALSQLGPFFQSTEAKEASELEVIKSLDRLKRKVMSLDAEVGRLFNLEMTPFFQESGNLDKLKEKMQNWLIQNTIRMDDEVRDVVSKSLEQRNHTVEKMRNH